MSDADVKLGAEDESEEKAPWSDIELLIVPCGVGARSDVDEEIAFIREMYPRVKYILSIDTGATLLARAGILDDRDATTSKKSWGWATSTGPNVNWIPSKRWVEDGNIWTISDVAVGSAMALAWVEAVYGKETGGYIANALEAEQEGAEAE